MLKMLEQLSISSPPDSKETVDISWHDINVFLDRRKFLFGPKNFFHILKNVSGQATHNNLLAIMGPSGCGKSTLLNALTGRNLSGLTISGTVLLNGKKTHPSLMADVSAYVQQDDVFIGVLTVQEHLFFQARLRMSPELSNRAITRRVDEVLNQLGLAECATSKIGVHGKKKTISGGQRKRLSFASEIITDPPILFADEPTSGLDAFMAYSVISLCKTFATSHRTVIITIHQPSSDVFQLFNQIMLLSAGKVAFVGSPEDCRNFYASLDPPLICPSNYNPADFYIQKIAIIPGSENESRNFVEKICGRFAESSSSIKKHATSSVDSEKPIESLFEFSKPRKPRIIEFVILLQRCFIVHWRENSVTSGVALHNVLIALTIGWIYFGQKMDQPSIMNINGAIFMMLVQNAIVPAVDVVDVFRNELPVSLRESDSKVYHLWIYFSSKIIAAAPWRVLYPTLFTSACYFMIGLNPSTERFFCCLLCIVIVFNVSTGFGYFLSTITSTLSETLQLVPSIVIPLVIFAGLPVQLKTLPIYLESIKYLSWPYYGFEILTVNQWKGVTNISCPNLDEQSSIRSYELAVNSSDHQTIVLDCIVSGDRIIERFSFDEKNLFFDFCMLILMSTIFHFLAMIALYNRVKILGR